MDTLQDQVNLLTTKVDSLYQLIEQLSVKLSSVVTECKFGAEQIHHLDTVGNPGHRATSTYSMMEASMEHKDVLIDSSSFELGTQSGEKQLSPEVQVQRLTAQLTAAYNRIAALEEQLLSQRIH